VRRIERAGKEGTKGEKRCGMEGQEGEGREGCTPVLQC